MQRNRSVVQRSFPGAVGVRLVWAAAVAGVAFAGLTHLPAARAEGSLGNYEAVAVAAGVRLQVISPGAPLSDTIADAAAPAAQSLIDGLGSSHGYASFLYPGDAALGLAPLVSGLALGGAVSPPAYPLIATSSHPLQPTEKVGDGPASVTSSSEANSSTARATAGGGAEDNAVARATAETNAVVDPGTGDLLAEASSVVDLVTVGSTLRIGRIESSAKAIKRLGAAVERSANLSIAEVTVNGVGATITEKGLVLAGSAVPASASNPELESALSAAGISLRLVAAKPADDGISSAALQISIKDPGGSSTQTYTFGGVSARVTGVAGVAGEPDTEVLSDEGGTVPPSFTSDSGSVLPGNPASFSVPTPTATPSRSSAGGIPASRVPIEPVGSIGLTDTVSFYLALVISAVVVLGGGQLIRLVGVKHRWIS